MNSIPDRGSAAAAARSADPSGPAARRPGPARRARDLPLHLVVATPSNDAEPRQMEVQAYRVDPREHAAPASATRLTTDSGAAYVLDFGEGDEVMLLVSAHARWLRRGEGGAELLERATRGAAGWRREQLREAHRARLPERLVAYSEALARAQTLDEVVAAVVEHCAGIVSGYCTAVFLRDPDGALRLAGGGGDDLSLREARLPPDQRFERPTLLTAEDSPADCGGPTAALAPLFERLRACSIAAVPFGRIGAILVVERRTDRRFEPDDWDLLRTVARQAESAVQRVELFREVRDLSLTDPLTGLANRRQLTVVLERGLAAARRGEPLTLALVDLDDFKGVNDRYGHAVGDRVLRTAAEALSAEARGSDLVARYGGDEFVVVLPGGRAASAETLLRRVEARLRGEVGMSAGVVEYAPGIASADELIAAADRELYHVKQRGGRTMLRAE